MTPQGRGGSPEPPWRLGSCNGCGSNGRGFPSPLSAEFGIRNETIRPIGFVLNQTSANWILTDVSKLLGKTFIMTHAMIEKISLPFHAAELRRSSFEIANQLR